MTELQAWFQTALGQAVAFEECRALERRLTGVYARRIVQIGAFGRGERPATFGNARQWLLDRWAHGPVDIDADPEELPFESGSLDVVLLIHQLEFAAHPHQVLREAARVVAPEGHLVLVGFNPLSLWGLRRALTGSRGRRAPWRGRFYGRFRLEDWLSLLGLSVEWRAGLMLRPPFRNPRLLRRTAGLERHAGACGHWLGGVQVTGARKRVGGAIPARPSRRPRLAVIPGGAQPASSVMNCGRAAAADVSSRPPNRTLTIQRRVPPHERGRDIH